LALTDAKSTFTEAFFEGIGNADGEWAVANALCNVRYDDTPILKRAGMVVTGLGDVPAWSPTTSDPTAKAINSPYQTSVNYAEYAVLIKATKLETADHGQTMIQEAGRALGYSTAYTLSGLGTTKAVVGTFTENGADGKGVFANDHPRGDGSSVQDNLLASGLDRAGLQVALKTLATWLAYSGHKVDATSGGLVLAVPPAELVNATEMVRSELSGSGNQVNVLKDFDIQIVSTNRFTSDTKWALFNKRMLPTSLWIRSAPEFDLFTDQYTHQTVIRVSFAAAAYYEPLVEGCVGSAP